jgi:integrase
MLKEKKGNHITVERVFLTPNPSWMKKTSKGFFFFNCPIGRNEISKRTRQSAESIGIDTKRIKVTNHSNRAAAVTQLAKVGVSENQIMKVTGHSNLASIKSYLQINSEHHEKIIQKMRSNNSEITRSNGSSIETPSSTSSKVSYSSCIFNNCSF